MDLRDFPMTVFFFFLFFVFFAGGPGIGIIVVGTFWINIPTGDGVVCFFVFS